jgi:glutamine amidotransferase
MARPPRIAVVDYGAGNLRSVARALLRCGLEPEVTGDPAALRAAEGVVLPGVGAFAAAVTSLREKGLDDAIRECLEAERPYLGICLGLQVLFEEGDEHGLHAGLGLLPGRVERFPERDAAGAPLRVPHIGWNQVRFAGQHPMLEALPEEDVFYFVHAYRVVPGDRAGSAGITDYGGEFTSAVATPRLFAVQFHPEKSQAAGRRLLDAFAGWVSECR